MAPGRPWAEMPADRFRPAMGKVSSRRVTLRRGARSPRRGAGPLAAALLASATAAGWAQEPSGARDTELTKKLQNPVADLVSVPFQANYDESFGPRDAGRFTLNVQPVIPIGLNEDWNLISRTILPVVQQDSVAPGVDAAFGLGDTVQSFFLSPVEPVGGWILGAGPVLLLPTGTAPELRREQLGPGPTAVALQQRAGWTYGALVNHLWNVTDPQENERVDATFLQPFLSYTWPTSTSLTLNAESTYDWVADDLTLPFNLQLTQVLRLGAQPLSLHSSAAAGTPKPPFAAPSGGCASP